MAEKDEGADPRTDDQDGDGSQGQQTTFDQAYVQQLRSEAAKYRTQRNDLQAKLDGFSDLGEFGSFDDLKAAAASWRKQEEKNKTEMEKLQDQIASLQSERDQAIQQAQDRLIQSAFVAEASKAGYAHPEDAFRLADLSDVTIDDDGIVKGVDKAVKALEGRLPKSTKPSAPGLDGGAGGAASTAQTSLTEAEIKEQAAVLNVDPVLLGQAYGVKITK